MQATLRSLAGSRHGARLVASAFPPPAPAVTPQGPDSGPSTCPPGAPARAGERAAPLGQGPGANPIRALRNAGPTAGSACQGGASASGASTAAHGAAVGVRTASMGPAPGAERPSGAATPMPGAPSQPARPPRGGGEPVRAPASGAREGGAAWAPHPSNSGARPGSGQASYQNLAPAEADALLAQAERLLRERRGRPPRCSLANPAARASLSPSTPRARRPSSSAAIAAASDSDASAELRASSGDAKAAQRGGGAGMGTSHAGYGPGGSNSSTAVPDAPGDSAGARRRRMRGRPHGMLPGASMESIGNRSQGFASQESAFGGASVPRGGDTLDYQLSEEEGTVLGSGLGSERSPGGLRMPRELLATGRFLDTEDVSQLLETGLGPASTGEPADGASDDEAESRAAMVEAVPHACTQFGAQGAGSAGPGAQAPEEPAELSLGAWVCSGGHDLGLGSGDPGSEHRPGSSRGSAPASLADDGAGNRSERGADTPASTLSSAGSTDTEILSFATPGGATPGSSFRSREASDDDEEDEAGGAETAWRDAECGADPNGKGKLPAGLIEGARRRSAEMCAICMDAPLQVRAGLVMLSCFCTNTCVMNTCKW